MNQLEALIFDVDGTLADTERDGHRVAFNLAFAEAGLDWEWSIARYGELLAVTGGKERIRHFFEQDQPSLLSRPDLDEFIAGLHQAKTRHYTELLASGRIPLRPGVTRLLQQARQEGLRLAIATTTTPANVEALLVHTLGRDALSWFEVIAAGDIVPAKKPAPDIYFYAMEAMGLQAGQCMAFEDSRNGILATTQSNLATIITVNDYTQHDDFSGALLVLDQMGEPEQAFQVLAGEAFGHHFLDIDLIKKLHEKGEPIAG